MSFCLLSVNMQNTDYHTNKNILFLTPAWMYPIGAIQAVT